MICCILMSIVLVRGQQFQFFFKHMVKQPYIQVRSPIYVSYTLLHLYGHFYYSFLSHIDHFPSFYPLPLPTQAYRTNNFHSRKGNILFNGEIKRLFSTTHLKKEGTKTDEHYLFERSQFRIADFDVLKSRVTNVIEHFKCIFDEIKYCS